MEINEILKILSNEYRLQMLQWLKAPLQHFSVYQMATEEKNFEGGVCVGAIATKAGLAQSVVSGYLNSLKQAGLVESKRVGKWTYYRYNPKAIERFLQQLQYYL
ncbi:ArsR family transcriptional regulator [Volucribacter psittacicida]|uniref:ArsR family transcriptional regulator n=1 Tax=Volucribacter psittacicida TaxID=203482 RepID=A0A4R1FYD6_9PAST|nr:metalloregulator ArsR/SmtB family transcription factor [Volucribacter psittacicida]TCJ98844.1 ArsR family transcriptional regulator [Volucribacter psittacicida]